LVINVLATTFGSPGRTVCVSDHNYRFYDIDFSGRITGARNRAFDSDAQALAHADQLLMNWPAIEVWQTDRLVGRVEQDQAVA
jgi:hypothetical protein